MKRQTLMSRLFVGTMLVLCGILGILQYRWIDEASRAERERLRGSLQSSLNRLSLGFNSELTAACVSLLPRHLPPDAELTDEETAAQYRQWKESSQHGQLFRNVALVKVHNDKLSLRLLNHESFEFEPAEWPAAWSGVKEHMEARLAGEPRPLRGPEDGPLIEVPRQFGGRPPGLGGPPRPNSPLPVRRNPSWMIVEVNTEYVRDTMIPELLQRHLGKDSLQNYQVEVLTRGAPHEVIYQTLPTPSGHIGETADAKVSLFEVQYEQLFRGREGRGGFGGQRFRAPSTEFGRWLLSVRHRAGSLDAVVQQARFRNLGVTAAILLLMLATLAALVRYTRRAQKLAELQMNFVTGVSHELRTPLTVIRTAAFNLRGRLSQNPAQVEKYGALIQQESERLTEMVEQILGFARTEAGQVIRAKEPISIEAIIDESLDMSRSAIEHGGCAVEKHIEPDLPPVNGDPIAIRQVLQNLLTNAAKYGSEGGKWIGVTAAKVGNDSAPAVEIRVADRGPGIPATEQASIFDPFFRGQRAVQDQIHGTGLGLNLVKKIVDAHGGRITVKSEPGHGAEFTVWFPAAAHERQDEFANTTR